MTINENRIRYIVAEIADSFVRTKPTPEEADLALIWMRDLVKREIERDRAAQGPMH